MSSCYEFNCYGHGRTSNTPVCYLCTCEQCGNILIYGTSLKCNSRTRNSFTYDPIPESFDEVQIIPDPPPQCLFNIYLCPIYESNSHYGYECLQRVPLVFPSFQTLPSFPQQYPCCEDCGVLPEADHCQPPQYTVNHPIFNAHNDLLNSQNKLMEQVTSMCEMFGQFIQKKHEEEQAANARYWKIPTCCDDDDDYNFAITPNEPVDSLSMGDEHLNTIPAMESDEFIKSSVENLEDIRLIEILLYDNSSPRPPKEFVSENFDAEIESFSPSPIPVKDSNSLMEEIDLSFNPDDPMSSGIEEDEYDSERDILILEELLDNYSLSLPENESFYFDIPSSSRPPAKPPDGPWNFQPSAKCPMMIHGKNTPILDVSLFHFYPLDQFKYGGELGQVQRPKTSASWEAPHTYL
nr:hypothetical protein [Tanacetum cinerariifolium]